MDTFSVRFWLPRQWRALLVLALCSVFSFQARAQTGEELQSLARQWVQEAVVTSRPAGAASLRMEVQVGAMDSRLKLAPCGSVEPYLPAGARLWGKSRVGVRCVDGMSRWNVTLPVTVKAMGSAWVVKGHVLAGAALSEADVVASEVDWAEDLNPVLSERSSWVGFVATRMLTTGQTLRQDMVKAAQVFQAGAMVRVLAQGPGFQVSGDAQALSAGVVGQVARVKMENGRVASGLVLDTRTVKIDL
jgi:flagella basal body P-ring formation protein FlgA